MSGHGSAIFKISTRCRRLRGLPEPEGEEEPPPPPVEPPLREGKKKKKKKSESFLSITVRVVVVACQGKGTVVIETPM